ncbi:MAG: hypothetical protein NC177_09520 [Ruminococcus flavefaciens]|nr:hypothetical protein [Ruminococcus flavefaciens]
MAEKIRPHMKVFLIMLVTVMTAVICSAFSSQPHYTWFTEKRTAKMENRFSIEVTDNIKLCEYKMSEFPAVRNSEKRSEYEYRLCLETDSIEKFMAENINGIITEKYDNMSFSYRNNDNQSVYAEISKSDGKENYSVTFVIVDI